MVALPKLLNIHDATCIFVDTVSTLAESNGISLSAAELQKVRDSFCLVSRRQARGPLAGIRAGKPVYLVTLFVAVYVHNRPCSTGCLTFDGKINILRLLIWKALIQPLLAIHASRYQQRKKQTP